MHGTAPPASKEPAEISLAIWLWLCQTRVLLIAPTIGVIKLWQSARSSLAEGLCRRTCSRHRLEVTALGRLHGAQEAPQAALVLIYLGVLRGQVQRILFPIQHLQQPQPVSTCPIAHAGDEARE